MTESSVFAILPFMLRKEAKPEGSVGKGVILTGAAVLANLVRDISDKVVERDRELRRAAGKRIQPKNAEQEERS